MVKPSILLLALLLSCPALSARKKEKVATRETLEFRHAHLHIDGDSVRLSAPVTFYGTLGGRGVAHHLAVTLATKADTTVSKLMYSTTLYGSRRYKRMLRETGRPRSDRKQGETFKLKRGKAQYMSLTMWNSYEPWMSEPLAVIVRQHHSRRPRNPMGRLDEQILNLQVTGLPQGSGD